MQLLLFKPSYLIAFLLTIFCTFRKRVCPTERKGWGKIRRFKQSFPRGREQSANLELNQMKCHSDGNSQPSLQLSSRDCASKAHWVPPQHTLYPLSSRNVNKSGLAEGGAWIREDTHYTGCALVATQNFESLALSGSIQGLSGCGGDPPSLPLPS